MCTNILLVLLTSINNIFFVYTYVCGVHMHTCGREVVCASVPACM